MTRELTKAIRFWLKMLNFRRLYWIYRPDAQIRILARGAAVLEKFCYPHG